MSVEEQFFSSRRRRQPKEEGPLLSHDDLQMMEETFGTQLSAFQPIDGEDLDFLSDDEELSGTLSSLTTMESRVVIPHRCTRCGSSCGPDSIYYEGLFFP